MAPDSSAPVMGDATISLSDTVMVNPMTILPKPNEFVFNRPEAWRFWKERFLRFGRLAVRQWGYAEHDWIDLLCYTMGEQSEEIMEQIMPDVTDKNLADVLQAFTDYFGQIENVTLQRYQFNSRIQLPDESVEQFITVLRILAESCQYGIMKDELIRDRIVAGLSDTRILEKLQNESCLTLERTIAIAREAEIKRTQHDEVSQDSSSTGGINCTMERSEAQQFPSDQSIDSKSLNQESCEETADRETGGKPKSVSCAKKKDGQQSAVKDNKGCDMGHNQQTHSFADKVENTAAISDQSPYNWRRPGQLEIVVANDQEAYLETVYKTVQQVMYDLKPQNFVESVDQLKMLEINSQAALQIAVELIYKKAVEKPSFSATLALMCKELAINQVSRYNSAAGKKDCYLNFKKLIITRCQMEFEKNTIDQNARAIKMKEIEACVDPEKKKGLENTLTKTENLIRIKSVDNIRFMGELFKQGMLTTNVMHLCIHHLLTQIDERSLEFLCKLLSTIGKDLESTNQNLDQYFKRMQAIINGKVPVQISLRVLLMLQDVIELRLTEWIPRGDDSSPKTMGQIQKKAEAESLDTHEKKTTLKKPRKNSQNSDNQRDRGRNLENSSQQLGSRSSSRHSSLHDASRSQSMSMPPPQPIKSNSPAVPASIPNKLAKNFMTKKQFAKKVAYILEEYLSDTNIDNAALKVRKTFDNSTFANFVRKTLNGVVEKSVTARKQVSQLMAHLMSENILPMPFYLIGLAEVLDMAEDLVLDIPKIWVYLAELILYPLAEGVVPFSELKTTMASLKNRGVAGKLMGELMIMLVQEKGPKWIKDEWDQAGLEWDDFLREDESMNDFIEKCSLAPKRSQQDKPKSNKLAVIPVSSSLREDVKLRETANAWKPSRMKPSKAGEEDIKTETLYKRVRGILNKLTPQKFATLVNQVRALKIDSQERLQGVIDLVFEKALDEPSFSVGYALMCKELAMMQVSGPDSKAGKEESSVNFRKLIITRCQMEFEKNTVDENAKAIKMQEIEACADPEKKKELQHILTEEERKIRDKSVGNIRFIGELFKQGMLTTNIMHRCIRHLLTQTDEKSLECLCKLLSTIGKDLESKSQNLDQYFKQMLDIVNRKGSGKVSSRVRFMLQDVVELRLNKWIPRRVDSNPKTMDQIQKEAETERLDTHMNNTPLNMPRKDDRNSDRKRNRGGGPIEEGGWSQPVRSRTQYSVEMSKFKNKPPLMENLDLGNKNMFQWSRNVSTDAPKTLTPNKFAMLDNMPSEQDKRSGLQLSGISPLDRK